MMKLSKTAVLLTSLLLGCAVLLGTVALPNIFGIITLASRVSEEYERVGEITRHAASYNENIKNLEYAETNLKKFEISGENDGGEIQLLKTIEDIARAVQTPMDLSLKEGKDRERAREVNIEMHLKAPYRNFLQFLVKLDELPYIITVKNIAIRKISEDLGLVNPDVDILMQGTVRFTEPI